MVVFGPDSTQPPDKQPNVEPAPISQRDRVLSYYDTMVDVIFGGSASQIEPEAGRHRAREILEAMSKIVLFRLQQSDFDLSKKPTVRVSKPVVAPSNPAKIAVAALVEVSHPEMGYLLAYPEILRGFSTMPVAVMATQMLPIDKPGEEKFVIFPIYSPAAFCDEAKSLHGATPENAPSNSSYLLQTYLLRLENQLVDAGVSKHITDYELVYEAGSHDVVMLFQTLDGQGIARMYHSPTDGALHIKIPRLPRRR